ncbi:tRNA (guanosine(37)-N1)-methyltransferase TrmD [Corynebacterium caspium]|uniref:tRNA (guanosine(37)-N1)-methyltransferase TrmD n=1 Tax=Corynebacterium caspium TaxID=234828 RepID=UPI000399ED40|nr:tRNA (guanosine(37)-N1)-methyltransferase TrmD [Corynebacterium caspium]
MRLDVVTIFPEYLEPLRHALLGKAIEQEILTVGVHDLRLWATDRHKSVDDTPFGGGPGMVMKPEVWGAALDDIAAGKYRGYEVQSAEPHLEKPRHDERKGISPRPYNPALPANNNDEDPSLPLLIIPTPAGTPFSQADAQAWSNEEHLVFACGRYEGIDQRVFVEATKHYRVREVSIGDYVLIGGEVAVLVMAEAIVRLIPGVLGNSRSHEEDSFSDGLLEGPSYTKPRNWRGLEVPGVLTSGNHGAVDEWRREQSLARTYRVRPELLEKAPLSKKDQEFLAKYRKIQTVLEILVDPGTWEKSTANFNYVLEQIGIDAAKWQAREINLSCQPDNMLVNQFQQETGQVPITEKLMHLEIQGYSAIANGELTAKIVEVLGAAPYWYGSSVNS